MNSSQKKKKKKECFHEPKRQNGKICIKFERHKIYFMDINNYFFFFFWKKEKLLLKFLELLFKTLL